jgi:hypothetical protein
MQRSSALFLLFVAIVALVGWLVVARRAAVAAARSGHADVAVDDAH